MVNNACCLISCNTSNINSTLSEGPILFSIKEQPLLAACMAPFYFLKARQTLFTTCISPSISTRHAFSLLFCKLQSRPSFLSPKSPLLSMHVKTLFLHGGFSSLTLLSLGAHHRRWGRQGPGPDFVWQTGPQQAFVPGKLRPRPVYEGRRLRIKDCKADA